jgi:GntR family transcriptional repressor for pyruvate dehydrogenase complex
MRRRTLLYEEIADEIKEYIDKNRFAPGDRLPTEEELCGTLGVSRTCIREAMKVLSGFGIITIQRGRGIFVKEPRLSPSLSQLRLKCRADSSVILELLDVRQVLELGVMDLVIDNASESDLKRMRESIKRTSIIAQNAPEKIGEEDLAFHLAYLHATNNSFIEEFGGTLRKFFLSWEEIRPYQLTSEIAVRALKEHQEIYDSIVAKDSTRLEKTLRVHLRRRKELLDSSKSSNQEQ